MATRSASIRFDEMPVEKLERAVWDRNPRRIEDRALEALARSLERFGVVEPIVYNRKTRRVVGGHQRIAAAKRLGLETLPIVSVSLDESDERLLNIALNQISGDWVRSQLAELFEELDEMGADLTLTGFPEEEIRALLNVRVFSSGEEKRETDPDEDKTSSTGHLYELGPHRILCGDATDPESWTRLLGGETPKLCMTDPPYGIAYDPRIIKTSKSKAWVEESTEARWDAVWNWIPSDIVYCWGILTDVSAAISDAGFPNRGILTWLKPSKVTLAFYEPTAEFCFFHVRKGAKSLWRGKKGARRVFQLEKAYKKETSHPCEKPVSILAEILSHHEGDVVEPFMGSGSTVIAASELGKRCFAIEKDPEIMDMALDRIERRTGLKRKRVE